MTNFFTYLIENNDLSREGLKSFLATTDFQVMGDARHVNTLLELPLKMPPQLVIVGAQRHFFPVSGEAHEAIIAEFMKGMDRVREKFPKTRLIMLVSRENITDIPAISACGADGYVLEDVSREAFISYLSLVMAGEKVFPPDMAAFFTCSNGGATGGIDMHPLSEREIDIIRCLAAGEANKLIARHLDITEATVKVHLKAILRKLNLCNRTQAALWAVRHGYADQAAAPERQAASAMPQPGLNAV